MGILYIPMTIKQSPNIGLLPPYLSDLPLRESETTTSTNPRIQKNTPRKCHMLYFVFKKRYVRPIAHGILKQSRRVIDVMDVYCQKKRVLTIEKNI